MLHALLQVVGETFINVEIHSNHSIQPLKKIQTIIFCSTLFCILKAAFAALFIQQGRIKLVLLPECRCGIRPRAYWDGSIRTVGVSDGGTLWNLKSKPGMLS